MEKPSVSDTLHVTIQERPYKFPSVVSRGLVERPNCEPWVAPDLQYVCWELFMLFSQVS